MNNNNSNAKKSRLEKRAMDGCIAEQFTQNGWFVKIKPALSIDKLVFSFVEKGKQGAGFDVYMDIELAMEWAKDICSGRFFSIISKEKEAGEKYPVTYKYVTGENASKSVGFCASTSNGNAATINGSSVENGKRVFANIPLDYWWLRKFGAAAQRIILARLVQLDSICLEAVKNNASRYHVSDDDEENLAETEVAQSQKAEEKQPVKAEQPKPAVAKTEPQFITTIHTTSKIVERTSQPGNYACSAVDANDSTVKYNVIIPGKVAATLGDKWKAVLNFEPEKTPLKMPITYHTSTENGKQVIIVDKFNQ